MDRNVSTNKNQAPDPTQGAILASIALPGIVGNIFAIIITVRILRLKAHQLSPNIFVLGLTCIDLFAVLGISTPSLICYAVGGWLGGDGLCRFQGFVALFCSLASGGIAVVMAIDRYASVAAPFHYRARMRVSLAKKIVLVVITGAGTLSLMPVGGIGGFIKSLSGTFCTFDWFPRDLEDVVYSYVILVYSGVLIATLVFCNVNVINKLCQKSRRRRTLSVSSDQANSSSRNSLEWQFGRMMIVISAIFLLCWIPFTVRVVCNLTGIWQSVNADVQASRLALLNFVIDPFTYVLTRTQYRKELRDLCSKTRRQRFGSESMSLNSRRTTRTSSVLQEIEETKTGTTHKTTAKESNAKSYSNRKTRCVDGTSNGIRMMTALPEESFGSDTIIGSLSKTDINLELPNSSNGEILKNIDISVLESDALFVTHNAEANTDSSINKAYTPD